MFIYEEPEKQSESHKLKLYSAEADSFGTSEVRPGLFSELVDSSLEQHHIWEAALRDRLANGEISPIAYYREIHGLDVADLASRARLRLGKVKKHLTPAGFTTASVDDLVRYAGVFDIGIADFFSFVILRERSWVVEKISDDVALQVSRISKTPSEER